MQIWLHTLQDCSLQRWAPIQAERYPLLLLILTFWTRWFRHVWYLYPVVKHDSLLTSILLVGINPKTKHFEPKEPVTTQLFWQGKSAWFFKCSHQKSSKSSNFPSTKSWPHPVASTIIANSCSKKPGLTLAGSGATWKEMRGVWKSREPPGGKQIEGKDAGI